MGGGSEGEPEVRFVEIEFGRFLSKYQCGGGEVSSRNWRVSFYPSWVTLPKECYSEMFQKGIIPYCSERLLFRKDWVL